MQKTTAPSDKAVKQIFGETLLSPLFLLAFILSITLFYCTGFSFSYSNITRLQYYHIPANHTLSTISEKLPLDMGQGNKLGCDIFEGKWIRDYGRPPYEEWECPYLQPQATCLEHGRPEKDYQYWSWQPHGCSLPRFNATLMLEALRGKRMMFVGDSVNRQQFFSMICLLQRAIPPHAHSLDHLDPLTVFTAKDYNATVEFFWAPFLVESNSDHPFRHRVNQRIIRNGSIDNYGRHWKGAHILVFNTYIWWIAKSLSILRRGSFKDEVKDIVEIDRDEGYRMAMKNLIQWLETNVNAEERRVFFVTMSPTHQRSWKWGGVENGNCYEETSMIEDPTYFAAEEGLMNITVEEMSKSRVPVTLLNITQLSSVRKDAHVSIYKQQWRPLRQEELAKPVDYADCIHWCLPGLPDIWNELLFAKLLYPN